MTRRPVPKAEAEVAGFMASLRKGRIETLRAVMTDLGIGPKGLGRGLARFARPDLIAMCREWCDYAPPHQIARFMDTLLAEQAIQALPGADRAYLARQRYDSRPDKAKQKKRRR